MVHLGPTLSPRLARKLTTVSSPISLPPQFAAGVQALAALSPALTHQGASLLPDLPEVRSVSVKVAAAVIKRAVEEGQHRVPELEGMDLAQIEERIKANTWDPIYRPLELVSLCLPSRAFQALAGGALLLTTSRWLAYLTHHLRLTDVLQRRKDLEPYKFV